MTSAVAPITAVVPLFNDAVFDLTQTYVAMLDELAAMVEHSPEAGTVAARIVTESLSELHVSLDELTLTEQPRSQLVQLANDVRELTRFISEVGADMTLRAVVKPLKELHAALVDEIGMQAWRAVP